MARKHRFVVLAYILTVLFLLSGCGLEPPDLKNSGWVDVQAGDGSCRVWVYNTAIYSSGVWTGGIAGSVAHGEGILSLYGKTKKVLEFQGEMIDGYAARNGRVFMGRFDAGGVLVKPDIVYDGEWSGGLPNGEGTMWVYDHKGNLNYILEGTFKNGAVTGKYLYTKDGVQEVREKK